MTGRSTSLSWLSVDPSPLTNRACPLPLLVWWLKAAHVKPNASGWAGLACLKRQPSPLGKALGVASCASVDLNLPPEPSEITNSCNLAQARRTGLIGSGASENHRAIRTADATGIPGVDAGRSVHPPSRGIDHRCCLLENFPVESGMARKRHTWQLSFLGVFTGWLSCRVAPIFNRCD